MWVISEQLCLLFALLCSHFDVVLTLPTLGQQVLNPTPPNQPCNMSQAKTEVALQFLESCRCRSCNETFAFLQCGCHCYQKLHCNKWKTALQHCQKLRFRKVALSCLLSCRFQAPMFRHPRLGPADWVLVPVLSEHIICLLLSSCLVVVACVWFWFPWLLVFVVIERLIHWNTFDVHKREELLLQ